MQKVILTLGKFYLKYEGGSLNWPHPEKTTLRRTSLISVKNLKYTCKIFGEGLIYIDFSGGWVTSLNFLGFLGIACCVLILEKNWEDNVFS